MKKTAAIGALLVAPLLSFSAASAVAATVDLTGATVEFLDIKDGAAGDLLFKASASTVSGDTLTLGLNAFGATSNQTVSDVMSFTIKALPNQFITSISYREAGAWSMAVGAGGGFVSASANWTVGSSSDIVGSFFTFASGNTGGTWASPADAPPIPPGTPQFAVVTFDFSAGVTEVYVSIANVLSAAASAGTASITKDSASVTVGTAVIPLPPSVWLLGSALFGVGVLGRRIRGVKAA